MDPAVLIGMDRLAGVLMADGNYKTDKDATYAELTEMCYCARDKISLSLLIFCTFLFPPLLLSP